MSNQDLQEFQEAYQQDFGEEISLEESKEMLTRLVTLYELLLRPLPGASKKKPGDLSSP